METVRDIIDRGAEAHPDKTFLMIAESGKSLTWRELCNHSRQINGFLNEQGIKPGATVAFLLDNGYWTSLLLLGIIYSGRVVLALNALSGKEALAYVVEHSDSELVFINQGYQEKYAEVFSKESSPQLIRTDENDGPDINFSDDHPAELAEISAQDIALLIYTSGTTGLPKGVLLSHQNIIAGGSNTMVAHGLTAEDIAFCVLPLYHINAQMVTLMAPLVSGGAVVMPRKFSVRLFWQDIDKYQCTWFSVVPTIISYLIEHNAKGVATKTMAKIRQNVRFGRSASAALSPAKHQLFEQRFGIPIVETMGLTETAAQILSNPMPPAPNKYGSPGLAVGNEAKILDEQGQEVEDGVPGELMIRGENVMQGYYKNPVATREALRPDGWLSTGDLSYRDQDGFFFITGRLKELIIKGGENIAPREIDDILYRHPAVLEAAAYGIDDEHYGQEVMACVAFCPGMEASEQELIELCIDKLGAYKSPKNIFIREELPKGPSGKIQRLKLAG